jgi:hypothetical protein
MDTYTVNQQHQISTINTNPIQVTNVKYVPSNSPALTSHWQAFRDANQKVQLKYLGGEAVGSVLDVTVSIGGSTITPRAQIV